jgi:hypothetical protein
MKLLSMLMALAMAIAAGTALAVPARPSASVGGPAKKTGMISGQTITRHH